MHKLYPFAVMVAVFATLVAGTVTDAAALDKRVCHQFQQALRQTPRGVTPLDQLLQTKTVTRIEPSGSIDQGDAPDALAREYGFTPPAIDKAREFSNEIATGDVQVFRTIGRYPLLALETVAGTLRCQYFAFFASGKDGVVPIAGPTLEEGDLCWDTHGDLAEFGQEPIFLVSSDDPSSSEFLAFHVTGAESTTPFCHLKIEFNVEFEISAASCRGPLCRDLQPQLPALAHRFDAGGPASLGARKLPPEAIAAAVLDRLRQQDSYATLSLPPFHMYRADIDNDEAEELLAIESVAGKPKIPYLIDSPGGSFLRATDITISALTDWSGSRALFTVPTDDDFLSPYKQFEEPSDYFPFESGTTTFLAKIGSGSFGWRTLDGYLLGVYDLGGGHVSPIAGFALTRVNASVNSVETISE